MLITKKELVDLARKNTIVLIGPTAAGKDTLLKRIRLESGSQFIVSHTTRPKRKGEVHGIEYWFVDDDAFGSLSMIEERKYYVADGSTWKYGLSERYGSRQGLLVLDWEGFLNFAKWRSDNDLPLPISVFLPIEKEVARERQKARGDYDENEFERRWAGDLPWIEEVERRADYIFEG